MGGRVVYVLDDDPTILSAVREFLIKKGLEVHGHTLWSEVGRKLLSDKRDAVLVCELNLPGIRGEEFCRTVLTHRKNVRVLLWSGGSEAELRGASERLGGVTFASKMDGLGGLVRTILELEGAGSVSIERPRSAAQGVTIERLGQVGPYLLGPTLLNALPVTSAPITIGRAAGQTLALPSPTVSRTHATLRRTSEHAIEVEDHGSTNGTLLDGHLLQGDKASVVADAVLDIGPYRFDLRLALTRDAAAHRAAEEVAGSSSLTVTGEKTGALLFFLAASELEGKLTFLEDDQDLETSRAWTAHVARGRLLRARYREVEGPAAIAELAAVCASVTFTKSRVDVPGVDAPRLIDVAGLLGGGARGPADPPTWPLTRRKRIDPGSTC